MTVLFDAIHTHLLALWNILFDILSFPLYLRAPPHDPSGQDRPLVIIQPAVPASIRVNGGEGAGAEDVSLPKFVLDRCPSLTTGFKPAWWLDNGHLQTFYSVLGNFSQVDKIVYERTLLRLPDGGTISLDSTPPAPLAARLPADAPTIVVAHGLTGGSHESYVRNLLEWVVRPRDEGGLGGRGVVVNYRGCADTPVTSPQFYSAGYTGDYNTAVHYLASLYPSSALVGVGFSLGASVVSRYMGEQGDACILKAGVALAAPWDLPAMSVKLETGWFRSQIYSNALGANVMNLGARAIRRYPDVFSVTPSEPADSPRRLMIESVVRGVKALQKKGRRVRLRDSDEVITSQMGGLTTVANEKKGLFPVGGATEYYQWGSAYKFITGVRRPLLAVNAMDDPIVDAAHIPVDEVQQSSHVILAVSSKGGHIAWFDGPLFTTKPNPTTGRSRYPQQRWIVKPVSEFISAVLHDAVDGPAAGVRRPVAASSDGWTWVKGSEDDLWGRVGWRVVADGAKVDGAGQSGTLQGL